MPERAAAVNAQREAERAAAVNAQREAERVAAVKEYNAQREAERAAARAAVVAPPAPARAAVVAPPAPAHVPVAAPPVKQRQRPTVLGTIMCSSCQRGRHTTGTYGFPICPCQDAMCACGHKEPHS